MWILSAPPGERYPKTAPHSHHAIQVSLALAGRVGFDNESSHASGVAIAIAPDSLHAFEGTELVAHLFVASEGQAGRAIVSGLFTKGAMVSIPADQLGDLPARLKATYEDPRHTDEDLRALGKKLIERLAGGGVGVQGPDARIKKLLPWVMARLDKEVSLSEVAEVVGLSTGRTRHLFVEQTGLPFRTYVLWLRLMRAVESYAGGASLTEAAHRAGFADSAHLSRTFRRMFGIVATSLRVS